MNQQCWIELTIIYQPLYNFMRTWTYDQLMGHCQLMGETAMGQWQISFRKFSFTGNMSWIYHILWMKATLHQLKTVGFLPSKVVQDFFYPPYVIQSLLSPIVFPYESPLRSGKSMENSCEAGVFHAIRPTWRADVIHLFLKWIYIYI